jgi:hypothetical protein
MADLCPYCIPDGKFVPCDAESVGALKATLASLPPDKVIHALHNTKKKEPTATDSEAG